MIEAHIFIRRRMSYSPAGHLVIPLRFGGAYAVTRDNRQLISAPPYLDALLEAGWVRMPLDPNHQADQPEPDQGGPVVEAEHFAAVVVGRYQPRRVSLRPHPDMLLPVAEGLPPVLTQALAMMMTAFSELGVPIGIDGPADRIRLPVGQWVRFIDDFSFRAHPGRHHLIVKNMLGTVVQDPYGVCTPGISIMVAPVGPSPAYGFPWIIVEPIDPPGTDEIEQAKLLAGRAWEDLRERGGWAGLVARGVTAEQALVELRNTIAQLRRGQGWKQRQGLLKRGARLLQGFCPSGLGQAGPALGRRCRDELGRSRPLETLLTDIERWIGESGGTS